LASQLEDSGLQPLLHMEEWDVGHLKKKGRPAGFGKASKREIYTFEHVESSFVNYKCSICGKMGHNKTSCVNFSLRSYFDRINNVL
jgi:hypothetical protein